jgi:hypothetical protein
MTRHRIILEPDGPGSFKCKFTTPRGEISGHVRVGVEGPPDNRTEADQEQAAANQILALSREFAEACATGRLELKWTKSR